MENRCKKCLSIISEKEYCKSLTNYKKCLCDKCMQEKQDEYFALVNNFEDIIDEKLKEYDIILIKNCMTKAINKKIKEGGI